MLWWVLCVAVKAGILKAEQFPLTNNLREPHKREALTTRPWRLFYLLPVFLTPCSCFSFTKKGRNMHLSRGCGTRERGVGFSASLWLVCPKGQSPAILHFPDETPLPSRGLLRDSVFSQVFPNVKIVITWEDVTPPWDIFTEGQEECSESTADCQHILFHLILKFSSKNCDSYLETKNKEVTNNLTWKKGKKSFYAYFLLKK